MLIRIVIIGEVYGLSLLVLLSLLGKELVIKCMNKILEVLKGEIK